MEKDKTLKQKVIQKMVKQRTKAIIMRIIKVQKMVIKITQTDQKKQSQEVYKQQQKNKIHGTGNNQSSSEKKTNNNLTSTNNTNKDSDQNLTGDARLKSLSINLEGMSPEFDKDILDYYLIVDLSIDEIEVTAVTEEETSTVSINGNTSLKEGENLITIKVTANDGNTRTYLIHVTKTDDVEITNANLKSLSIKGFSFYPGFKSNIYSYNLIINEKISKLEFYVETENEQATYEIVGNENLEEGEN